MDLTTPELSLAMLRGEIIHHWPLGHHRYQWVRSPQDIPEFGVVREHEMTAMYFAAISRRPENVHLLCDMGVSASRAATGLEAPLYWSLRLGDEDTARAIHLRGGLSSTDDAVKHTILMKNPGTYFRTLYRAIFAGDLWRVPQDAMRSVLSDLVKMPDVSREEKLIFLRIMEDEKDWRRMVYTSLAVDRYLLEGALSSDDNAWALKWIYEHRIAKAEWHHVFPSTPALAEITYAAMEPGSFEKKVCLYSLTRWMRRNPLLLPGLDRRACLERFPNAGDRRELEHIFAITDPSFLGEADMNDLWGVLAHCVWENPQRHHALKVLETYYAYWDYEEYPWGEFKAAILKAQDPLSISRIVGRFEGRFWQAGGYRNDEFELRCASVIVAPYLRQKATECAVSHVCSSAMGAVHRRSFKFSRLEYDVMRPLLSRSVVPEEGSLHQVKRETALQALAICSVVPPGRQTLEREFVVSALLLSGNPYALLL